jgi:hypothetical protein
MLWKIVTVAVAALALWNLARRIAGPPASERPGGAPGRGVEDLARCVDCGAWLPRAEPCLCATPPTP